MNTKFLRIDDNVDGLLQVKTRDLLEWVPLGLKNKQWQILILDDVTLINQDNRLLLDIERRIREQKQIIILSFEELTSLMANKLQALEVLIVVADRTIKTNESRQWDYLCGICDCVIESFDTTYCSLFINSYSDYRIYNEKFNSVKEVDVDKFRG